MASDPEDAIDRRLSAGTHVAAGAERALAKMVEPALLACRDEAAADRYLSGLSGGARWYDYFAAAVVLSWQGNESGTLRYFREAAVPSTAPLRGSAQDDTAEGEVAVAARERLSHHALLFGDVALARNAIDDALALAKLHHLANWRLRCAASAARLALDAGDVERAAKLLDEARAAALPLEMLALFAPTGAQLAAAAEDEAGLRVWTSPEVLDVALRSSEPRSAIAGTIACLLGARALPPPRSPVSVALRRALLQAENATNAAELFSLAARYGDADEARFGVDGLRAVFAPHRPYLAAHFLLARAHWCFRFGARADAIDSAGDAARAFDAIGLRRWTDDAMLLMVHQEGVVDTQRRRRRPTAFSLTGREQQVAHLIRRGASNREVARTLQISEHTVERHVSSILSRLGLRSRWQIVDARNAGNEH